MHINIYNIKYVKDKIIIRVNNNEINKISKFFDIEIINYYGEKKIINYFKHNILSFIFLSIIIFLIFLFTRIIIDIDVITENNNLESYILNELDKNGIKKYTLIKNSQELNEIKKIILSNNKDLIEWMNIERQGMKYIINIEPKVSKNKKDEKTYCNIVSLKDSVITRIITSEGMELVDVNDSVKKGDILISGDIKFNEEVKKQVCASGTVYGRTWYTVNLTLPKSYEYVKKLNKFRYNLLLKFNNKSYKIFKSRLKNYKPEDKKILNFWGFELYLQKEVEVDITKKDYNDNELNENINKMVLEKLSHTLNGEYKIIDQKVLKKDINDSKINMELFIVAEEEIGTVSTTKINEENKE